MELKPIRTDERAVGRGVTYEAADVLGAEQGRKVLRNLQRVAKLFVVRVLLVVHDGSSTFRSGERAGTGLGGQREEPRSALTARSRPTRPV